MRILIKLFYTFVCVVGLVSKLAAAELVVPFSDAFFGDHNDGSIITAENVQLFSTIGLDLNFFAQSSGGVSFEDSDNNTLETVSCNGGNDVPGRLRIRAGGYFTDIPGCIDGKYKDGGVTKAFNFNPAAAGPISYTNSSGGTTTINIQDNSYTALNIGVIKNPYTAAEINPTNTSDSVNNGGDGDRELDDGEGVSGDSSGVLTDLNSYLTLAQSNEPSGPITVNSITYPTSETDMIISGSVTLSAGEEVYVIIDGRLYTSGSGQVSLTNNTDGSKTWSVNLGQKSAGIYEVSAWIIGDDNWILQDSSTNELTVTSSTASIAQTTNASENNSGSVTDGLFTVTLSNASATDTVIAYTVSGTATSGSDYTALSGSVTITAGSTTGTISVPVTEDTTVEGSETVIVTLSSISSGLASLSGTSSDLTATVTLADDDSSTASIAQTTNASENNSGSVTDGLFTVTLSNASATDTVIAYTVSGTATSGSDYTALSGSVTITAGSTTGTISVPVTEDTTVEGSETVIVTLSSISSGLASLSGTSSDLTATVTLADDDSSTASIAQTTNASENNSGSVTDGLFTVTLSNASATDTVIAYTVSGTATSGSDYTALSGSVTITAGSTTGTISVPVTEDTTVEGSETVIVTLSSISSGLASLSGTSSDLTATVTLADDDSSTASIAQTTNASENNSGSVTDGLFTVTLSNASATDTVIAYTVSGTATSGSDYTALSGSVTITAGSTTGTISVPVTEDTTVEGSETVIVTLSSISSGLASLSGTSSDLTATVTLADDDSSTASIAQTTNASENNSGSVTDGLFTVTLSNASATDTVIAYTVSGTATSGSDYTALSGSVTITAGSTTGTISVPVTEDTTVEGSETVIVTLSSISSGLASLSGTSSDLTATVTLADDDSSTASIAQTTNASENNSGSVTDGLFTVTLSNASATDTVIAYTVSGTATSGSDYTALSGSVTITAGSTTGTISVPVTEDTTVEGSETVIVTLSSISSGLASLSGTSSDLTATVTLADDDSSTASIAQTTNASENNSGSVTDGLFTVTLSNASATDTVIAYTVSGTATSGSDYTALSGSVTITAGSTTGTISVPVTEDTTVEGSETVIVTLSSISSGLASLSGTSSDLTATVTLADDDSSTASIAQTTNASENNSGSVTDGLFTVTLSNASATDTVIAYTVSGTATSGSDYTALSGSVTITAGSTTGTISVPVTEDTTVEGSETVIVTLSSISSGLASLSGTSSDLTATVTLADDDSSSSAAMLVTKTAGTSAFSSPVSAGDVITYTITAKNTGNVTLDNVSIADALTPTGGSASSLTPTIDATATGTADDDSELDVGETWTWTVSYTLVQSDIDAGGVSNLATVTADDPNDTAISVESSTSGNATSGSGNGTGTSTTLSSSAAMLVTKTADTSAFSSPVSAGDVITYTITAKNTGNVTLDNVSITDALTPTGGSASSLTPTIDATATGTADDDSELDVGETWTWTVSYTLVQSDIDAGGVSNLATVTADDPNDTAISVESSTSGNATSGSGNGTGTSTTLSSSAAMLVTKTADTSAFSSPVSAGDVITYTITAKNTGNVTLDNVSITDALTPTGGSASSLTPTIDATATGTADDDSELDVGETWTWTVSYTLVQSDIDAGGVSNLATVTADDPNDTAISVESSTSGNATSGSGNGTGTSTTLSSSAAMLVTKTADTSAFSSPVSAGDVITYTITAKNTGNVTLDNVSITDALTPTGGSASSLTPTIDATATGTADDDSELDVGETWTWTVSYTLVQSDIDAGGVSNLATVTADDPNDTAISVESSTSGNATSGSGNGTGTSTTLSSSAAMLVTKTADTSAFSSPVSAGDVITYTITAKNTGNVTLDNVSITDALTPTGGSASSLTPTIDATATGTADDDSELDVGETWTWTVSYTLVQSDIDAGGVSNLATVTADDPNDTAISVESSTSGNATSGSGNGTGTSTTLSSSAAMLVTKTADTSAFSSPVSAGDVITYTITAKNTGNVTLDNVSITDALTPTGGSASSLTPTIDATATGTADDDSELDVGETWTWTVSYTLVQSDIDAGGVSNLATVTADDPNDTAISVESSTSGNATSGSGNGTGTSTTLSSSAAMLVTKTADTSAFSSPVSAGDVITYTITAKNTGNVTLDNVSITDALTPTGGSASSLTPTIDATATGTADDDSELDVGETWTWTVSYTLVQSDIDAGGVSNLATVTADDPNDTAISVESSTSGNATSGSGNGTGTSTTLSSSAAMLVTKTADTSAFSSPVSAGDVITYTITAKNTGNVTLDNVSITDALTPTGGSASSLTPTIDATATGTADDDSELDVGETWTWTVSYTLVQSDIDAGGVSNLATVTADDPNDTAISVESSTSGNATSGSGNGTGTSTTLSSSAAMLVTKTADTSAFSSPVSAGDVITYTITAKNTGNVTLDNVSITDALTPTGGSASSLTPTIDATATGTADDDSELDVGETWTWTVSYTLVQSDIDAGGVSNLATVTADDPNDTAISVESSTSGNATSGSGNGTGTSTTLSSSAAMLVTKTADTSAFSSPVSAGDVITYTITAKNTGNVTLDNVSITDALTPTGGSASSLTPTIDATATGTADDDSELDVGETWTWTVSYTLVQSDIDAGGVSNLATVTADDPNDTAISVESSTSGNATSGSGNGTGTSTTLSSSAAMLVTKTADTSAFSSPVSAGDVITYTITAKNTGNVTLDNVSITDALTPTGGSASSLTPTIDATATGTADDDSELDVGETWTWTVSYTLVQSDIDAGGVSNLATVTADDPNDTAISVESSTSGNATSGSGNGTGTSTTLERTAGVDLIKTASLVDTTGDGSSSDDFIKYEFTITNLGNTTLTDLKITDDDIDWADSNEVIVNSVTLRPGQSESYSKNYPIKLSDIDVGSIQNQATVVASSPAHQNAITDLSGPTSLSNEVTVTFLGSITGNATNSDGTPAPGTNVEIYDLSVTPPRMVSSTVTLANGSYFVNELPSGTYGVKFSAVNKMVQPIAGNVVDSDNSAQVNVDMIEAIDIAPGKMISENADVFLVDPAGIVYDSISRTAIAGARVSLLKNGTLVPSNEINGAANPQVTGVDGRYAFFFSSPASTNTYSLKVEATNYDQVDGSSSSNSQIILPSNDQSIASNLGLTLISEGHAGVPVGTGVVPIVPLDAIPNNSDPTTYFLSFDMTFADWQNGVVSKGIVHNHIPLDPSNLNKQILVTKSGSLTSNVSDYPVVGDQITFTISVQNTGNVDFTILNFEDPKTLDQNESLISGDLNADQNLNSGETWVYQATYELTKNDLDLGYVENMATITVNSLYGDEIYESSPQGNAVAGLGNGSNTVVSFGRLIDLVRDDLEKIIETELTATMRKQSTMMREFASEAADNLSAYSGAACVRELNNLINRNPILFETASAKISAHGMAAIDKVVDILKQCDDETLGIAGHTDSIGSEDYNKDLSARRISSVLLELEQREVDISRFVKSPWGEEKPVADNLSEAGRAKNRRIEFYAINKSSFVDIDQCGEVNDLDPDGTLNYNDRVLEIDAKIDNEFYDCSTATRRVIDAKVSYSNEDGLVENLQSHFSVRAERQVNHNDIVGKFAAIYITKNAVLGTHTGNISGAGLSGGFYGAREMHNGLRWDYYGGASLGKHEFDLTFNKQIQISAIGNYTYAAGYLGTAISGDLNNTYYSAKPRAGVDFATSSNVKVSSQLSHDIREESAQFKISPISGLTAYAELAVSNLRKNTAQHIKRDVNITPRIFCDRKLGTSATHCGFGVNANLENLNTTLDRGFNVSIEVLKSENFYQVSMGVVGYDFLFANGDTNTSVELSKDGKLGLKQVFSWEF